MTNGTSAKKKTHASIFFDGTRACTEGVQRLQSVIACVQRLYNVQCTAECRSHRGSDVFRLETLFHGWIRFAFCLRRCFSISAFLSGFLLFFSQLRASDLLRMAAYFLEVRKSNLFHLWIVPYGLKSVTIFCIWSCFFCAQYFNGNPENPKTKDSFYLLVGRKSPKPQLVTGPAQHGWQQFFHCKRHTAVLPDRVNSARLAAVFLLKETCCFLRGGKSCLKIHAPTLSPIVVSTEGAHCWFKVRILDAPVYRHERSMLYLEKFARNPAIILLIFLRLQRHTILSHLSHGAWC